MRSLFNRSIFPETKGRVWLAPIPNSFKVYLVFGKISSTESLSKNEIFDFQSTLQVSAEIRSHPCAKVRRFFHGSCGIRSLTCPSRGKKKSSGETAAVAVEAIFPQTCGVLPRPFCLFVFQPGQLRRRLLPPPHCPPRSVYTYSARERERTQYR